MIVFYHDHFFNPICKNANIGIRYLFIGFCILWGFDHTYTGITSNHCFTKIKYLLQINYRNHCTTEINNSLNISRHLRKLCDFCTYKYFSDMIYRKSIFLIIQSKYQIFTLCNVSVCIIIRIP